MSVRAVHIFFLSYTCWAAEIGPLLLDGEGNLIDFDDYPTGTNLEGYEIVGEPIKRFEDFADNQLIGLARPRFGKRGSIEEMIRPRFGKRSDEVVKRRAGFPLFDVEVDPKYKRALYVNNLNPFMQYDQGEVTDDDIPTIIYTAGVEKRGLEEMVRPRFGKRALEDMIRPRYGKRSATTEEVFDKRALEEIIRPRFGKRSLNAEVYKRALEEMIRPRFGKRAADGDDLVYKRAIEDMIRPRFGKRSIEEMIRPRFGKRGYGNPLSSPMGVHKPLSPSWNLYQKFGKRTMQGYGAYNAGSMRMVITPYGPSYVTPGFYYGYKPVEQAELIATEPADGHTLETADNEDNKQTVKADKE